MKIWIILIISVMSLSAQEGSLISSKCFVIGHRGAPAYGGENTIWGFRKALDLGADGFELDIIPTKDGKLIVGHDFDLKRLIGEAQLNDVFPDNKHYYCTDFSQKELQELKVTYPAPGQERPKHQELGDDYSMPTLEEALDFLVDYRTSSGKSDLKIYIEIKTKKGFMHTANLNSISYQITKALEDRALLNDKNVWIQSFDYEMMDVIAGNPKLSQLPKCQLAFDGISEIGKFRKSKKARKFLKKKIVTRGLQMFHVWKVPSKYILEKKQVPFIDIAHEMGIPVHIYTFRDQRYDSDYKLLSALGVSGFDSADEELRYFLSKGVDAIMSDDVVSALNARDGN